MQQATGAIRRMLASAGVPGSVGLGLHLYDVIVRPIATYASPAWVPSMRTSSSVLGNPLERAHLDFLRVWCRLRPFVSSWALYRELGRLPFHFHGWLALFRFWNQLQSTPNARLWQQILHDAFQAGPWGVHVREFASRIGFPLAVDTPVDLGALEAAILRSYDGVWAGLPALPRVAEDHVRLTTYYRWFDGGRWRSRPPYLRYRVGNHSIVEFLRFKLASHNLGIELGRWHTPVPRSERLCPRCHLPDLDDERHLVFDCLAFEDLRHQYRQLFTSGVGLSMSAFFSQRDQLSVLRYVVACLRRVPRP